MDQDGLRWRPDVDVGGWIAPRLGPFGGRVGSVVPRGFASYARVLHPVPDISGSDGPDASWSEVCAFTGRRPHALMQWHAIANVPVPGSKSETVGVRWDGADAHLGNLGAPALAALCDVLTAHTPADAECYFALWEGYGWIHGSPAVAILGSSEPVPPAYPREILDGPRLHHPHRDYIVFSGPLEAATRLGHRYPWGQFEVQSPNLFWPDDRSWCVATEIDFDSTLVAGTPELIEAVIATPALEAWVVRTEDSLAFDSDTVNT